MIVEASVTGLIKTTLIIIGAMVVLKFIGQLMIAKRNLSAQNKLKEEEQERNRIRIQYEKNKGKTSIINRPISNVEDVDFIETN
jgi:hypothetical protein